MDILFQGRFNTDVFQSYCDVLGFSLPVAAMSIDPSGLLTGCLHDDKARFLGALLLTHLSSHDGQSFLSFILDEKPFPPISCEDDAYALFRSAQLTMTKETKHQLRMLSPSYQFERIEFTPNVAFF
ncbi:hypothetical protein [uncultured Umboniibacter sp.]|uniref:hypothetical protein n=1 Tax=uncultured Umboniibacter sp. TaxID=1798917 RepID=UPI002603DD9A|nr:hypothetical protein [uncultured Umboniibacter sp.]